MGDEQLVLAYLRYFEQKQQSDEWAAAAVDAIVRRDPDAAWEITRSLVNGALSGDALAYVAAGPLEDLIVQHGPAVIGRIEEECITNDRLRVALSGVWVAQEDPVWDRWYRLMWKYGFAEGRRLRPSLRS